MYTTMWVFNIENEKRTPPAWKYPNLSHIGIVRPFLTGLLVAQQEYFLSFHRSDQDFLSEAIDIYTTE